MSAELMTGTCISTAKLEKTNLYMQWKHLKFNSVLLTQLFLKFRIIIFNTLSSFMTPPLLVLQYHSTEKIQIVFLEKKKSSNNMQDLLSRP